MTREQLNKYLISDTTSIVEALRKLNALSNAGLTLFVQDCNLRIIGTLTDGDIRRYLISGGNLQDVVASAMKACFCTIQLEEKNLAQKCYKYRQSKIRVVPILNKDGALVDVLDFEKQKSKLPIDAIIMAGGKGERLRPLTLTTPKPLLRVGNKAIIDHNIDRLISYGVKHISVTTNYLAEQLEEHFKEPHNDVQVQCVRETTFLGTMGSVRLVKELHNDVILVMNSDLFTNIDFEAMYLHFMEHNADMSMAVVPYDLTIPYGILETQNELVQNILEKPTYTYYANAGIYLIKRELLELIPEGTFFNATDMIKQLIDKGYEVRYFPLNGTWIDIGSMTEYQKANELIKHLNTIH